MKSIIVYYSFSGGTHKIAHAIHKGIEQATGQCDIAALKGSSGIPGMKPADLLEYDLIGFGSPVWGLLPTPNMMALINSLANLRGKHCLAFLSHGLMPTRAPRTLVNALKSKQATVIGWNDWFGACYPWDMYKPYWTDGHPDEIDLKEAERWGQEMVLRSQRVASGEKELLPVMPKGEAYYKLYGRRPSPSRVPAWGRRNSFDIDINIEKCTQCHLCVDNCPTGSINLETKPFVNSKSCERCSVCEQICPTGAVVFDFESVADYKKWGKRWERLTYFHKFALQLNENPRFRRLVPVEEVGKYDHWYEISKHPRIILPS
jgi:ferredoxin/flavodoxin